jgi:SAM-dependent methyltransferase
VGGVEARCRMGEPFHTSHTAVEERVLRTVLVARPAVLEPGCGRTTRLAGYRHRIRRLVGVDLDDEAGRQNVALDEFLPGDATGPLPFAPASFDVVYANFVVEHLARPAAAFREWRRLLPPGGSLVLTTSNVANPAVRIAHALPQRSRLAIKRDLAGVDERDVFPAVYRSNTVGALDRDLRAAGFSSCQLSPVATVHRYAGTHRRLAGALRFGERLLPADRRSTIVAWYRAS